MVSDSDLVGRLREFLSTSDLNTTTAAIVRRQLEEDFGIDLSDKKAFIREQIDAFLQHYSGEGDEKDGNDEESKEIKYEENGGDDSEGRGQEKEVEEEEVEEEEDEDEEAGNGKTRAKRKSSQSEVKKRGGGGFTKLCSLSPKLQKFTGVPELARTEVVKQLWAYIREKNLQDPSNRRNINCDDTLRDLFGVNTINMFQMNKVLAKHIWPLDSDGAAPVDPSPSKEKEKPRKKGNGKDPSEWKSTEKRQKTGNSGILAALPLSDALIKFLGTGENTLSRPEAVSRLWHYIKNYNLQDPSDKRRILCDEKLKELFGVDTFNGFSVTKLLSAHFMKAEKYFAGKEKNLLDGVLDWGSTVRKYEGNCDYPSWQLCKLYWFSFTFGTSRMKFWDWLRTPKVFYIHCSRITILIWMYSIVPVKHTRVFLHMPLAWFLYIFRGPWAQ